MTARTNLVARCLALLLLTLAAGATPLRADDAPNDAVDRTRLQAMLAAGDNGMIVATFKRHPAETLPFIDNYLEGGLAMIEKKGDAAASDAMQSFRQGVRFAKLADEAFGGTTFSDYANAFASWSPSEQKSFREGQKLYREGAKLLKDDAAKAVPALERSYELASSLRDTWGMAMAAAALADAHLKLGDEHLQPAFSFAERAVRLYQSVQFEKELVGPLRASAAARAGLSKNPADSDIADALRRAWSIVRDSSSDTALRRAVAEEYCAALERAGKKDDADKVRADLAKRETVPTT
jgi:hypothetical protein